MTDPTASDAENEIVGLYRETVGPLYGYVSRRTGGDRALSEDVTQEAWLRAVREWRRAGVPDRPLAWLRTVARNLLANHYRRRRPATLEGLRLDPEQPPLDPATPEAAALVNWGLSRLTDEQGRLLEAFHLDGRSLAEIAAECGLSERAVEGRIHRARKKLARVLRPRIPYASPTNGGSP